MCANYVKSDFIKIILIIKLHKFISNKVTEQSLQSITQSNLSEKQSVDMDEIQASILSFHISNRIINFYA